MGGTSDFGRDLNLMHELVLTGRKAGARPEDYGQLADSEEKFRQVLAFLRGAAEIKPFEHLIDCDATPFIPECWRISPKDQLLNVVHGLVNWKQDDIKFHLPMKQKKGRIRGYDLFKTLKGQVVYPANTLDHLLANPQLIPEEWKKISVNFWGTVYRGVYDLPCVRYLYWDDDRWDSCWRSLCHHWDSDEPAAVRAS